MINFELDIARIATLLNGETIGEWVPDWAPVQYLAWDTRKIHHPESTLFIALQSDKRDGHDFIQQAFEKGVRRFWISRPETVPSGAVGLLVPDTLQALQELAGKVRAGHPGRFIGITGSNGKTMVKEWLKEMLEPHFKVGASPGSFNSQLGVALSILQLPGDSEINLVEAGISRPGEMARLEAMVKPDWGIMTHFGDAHAEGFASPEAKLREKAGLFAGVERLFLSADQAEVVQEMKGLECSLFSIGGEEGATVSIVELEEKDWGGVRVVLEENGESVSLEWSMPGQAARENILLVALVARALKLSWEEIQAGINRLHPVSMRMEMLTDNPEVTIINDAYNADRASVLNALTELTNSDFQRGHIMVLSDLEHLGALQEKVQAEILNQAGSVLGFENIYLVGPQFYALAQAGYAGVHAFQSVADLIADFDYERFRNRTVLLKGARRYELERLIPYLSRRASATHFKINLDHLRHNYAQFRARLKPGVKMMAMVKAFAYGSGDWEVAQALATEGIDYLAVAYTSAGIALRTHGVSTPIMVMNADPEHIPQLFRFDLEPVVYGFPFLTRYLEAGGKAGVEALPMHIKVDTGMSRLGFLPEEVGVLAEFLSKEPRVQLLSVMSHLAMADEVGGDAYSHEQSSKFLAFSEGLGAALGQQPMKHLVNTAGIIRFPEYHFDMVRLGLGLYGTSPMEEETGMDLQEVGSLHSVVTQVHTYPAGQSIGYGGSSVTERESRIATVAIGYADGIRRSLSNGKMSFLVRGKRAPTIGRVCMDMLMLDVTHIPEVALGDEVVLLGAQGQDYISVREMAEAAGTIAYEILVNIGQRVRRVYLRE